ncbi:unnamed protein product [Nippostrongylus brasiliensis]|uniref:Sequestosome-1 (inferred by orthology to a human protein) n=1 Tax=Nippostrongylus brasiliensis TaxID=27835 RepID=A0A0N4Y3V8_NIPBR|nr:unnamed protein product [Nippostrongylus brasiliensis]
MEVVSVKLSNGNTHRRFKIKGNGINALFSNLMENLSQVSETDGDFDVAWQDEDGDSVVITRAMELGEALEARNDNVLRLHTIKKSTEKTEVKEEKKDEEKKDVKSNESNADKPPAESNMSQTAVHKNVLCDLCDREVVGTRYRCLLCVDYDLCQDCEKTGVHGHHGMIRIVNPMCTFVPWGGRLRYLPAGCPRGGGRFGRFGEHGSHRRRMDEAKEQITERVTKSVQYLQEMGQAVTAALANLGIDASYEVKTDEAKEASEKGKPPSAAPETQQEDSPQERPPKATSPEKSPSAEPETQQQENPQERAPTPPKATSPSDKLLSAGNKFDNLESAGANYFEAMRSAAKFPQENKIRHSKEKAEDVVIRSLRRSPEIDSQKPPSLISNISNASTEKVTDEAPEAKERTTDCRCFVSGGHRGPRCPACQERDAERKKRQAEREYARASAVLSEDHHNSTLSDSSDSDFETLSYDGMHYEQFKHPSEWTGKPQDADTVNKPDGGGDAKRNASNSTIYPSLVTEPSAPIVEQPVAAGDQGIAYRMIEMGFSADEVFRVVRMHGNNFEKCIEEILRKRRTENWMTEEQKAVMARLRKKPTEMRDKVLEFFNQLPAEIRAEWDEYHMKECFEWVKTVASDDEMSELKKLESNKDIDKLVAKVYTYLPRLPDRRLARVELWKDECIRLLKKESRRLRDSEQN